MGNPRIVNYRDRKIKALLGAQSDQRRDQWQELEKFA
jgi:hypothetical protein